MSKIDYCAELIHVYHYYIGRLSYDRERPSIITMGYYESSKKSSRYGYMELTKMEFKNWLKSVSDFINHLNENRDINIETKCEYTNSIVTHFNNVVEMLTAPSPKKAVDGVVKQFKDVLNKATEAHANFVDIRLEINRELRREFIRRPLIPEEPEQYRHRNADIDNIEPDLDLGLEQPSRMKSARKRSSI